MNSLILSTGLRILYPLFLIFSFFLLFRGHNAPGGGFIAALVTSTAFILYALSFGVDKAKKALQVEPLTLMAAGLTVAISSACVSLFLDKPLFKGLWLDITIPLLGKAGTPLMFDVGVYLLVTGVVLKIIFSLWKK